MTDKQDDNLDQAEEQTVLIDLLALRDGELLDAPRHDALLGDPDAAVRLRRLELIRQELEALPDIEPADDTWARIQAQSSGTLVSLPTPARERRSSMRYPLATAATVFFAVLALSIVVGPELKGPTSVPQPGQALDSAPSIAQITPAPQDSLAALVDRSQSLEAVARVPVVRQASSNSASRDALLIRIAELDEEINRLIEQDSLEPALKEQLYRQRVDLLETLLTVQREQLKASAELF
ncbi:MAG: hypothetical protein AAF648_10870 [Pseudomonadota bacterium]